MAYTQPHFITLSNGDTWDATLYKFADCVATGNTTLTATLGDPDAAVMYFIQDATGSRTLTLNGTSVAVDPSPASITEITVSQINGRGKINSDYRPATVTEPEVYEGVLDTTALSATRAYSLRKLTGAYSGPCCQIKRSSDGTLQDIGFDSSGNMDSAAASTFIGGGSGVVTIWYDQMENSDAVAPSGREPLLVLSGIGSKPTLRFTAPSGAEKYLAYGGPWSGASQRSLFAVYQNKNASFTDMVNNIAGQSGGTGGSVVSGSWFVLQSRTFVVTGHPYLAGYGADLTDSTAPNNTTPLAASVHYNGTHGFVRRNGTEIATGALTLDTDANGYIGADNLKGGETNFCDAEISEVIITSTYDSTKLSGVETDQKTYYGIA